VQQHFLRQLVDQVRQHAWNPAVKLSLPISRTRGRAATDTAFRVYQLADQNESRITSGQFPA
jgi:hypothetical protein